MLVAVAGEECAVKVSDLGAMASALRGHANRPRAWLEDRGCAGLAGVASGILPEDVFDRQPITDDALAFACEARLDERSALAAQLDISPAQAKVMADSELLACAYRRWGEETPQHVYGDYAFVAWERNRGRLIAAVDHIGAVPLFYSVVGTRIVISTQLAALLAHPGVPKVVDSRALGLMVAPKLGLGWTMFRNVCHLTGGSTLKFEKGSLQLRQWWNPSTAAERPHRDNRDYVEQAKVIFSEAVSTRLRAVGGIAATLSGGLDSGLVSAFAAQLLEKDGRTLFACTSIPEPGLATRERPGWDPDDRTWAAATAARYPNLIHRLVAPDGVIPPDIFPVIHTSSCTPVRNAANAIWLMKITELARDSGARVVLWGQNGNATISADGIPPMRGAHQSLRHLRISLATAWNACRGAGQRWLVTAAGGRWLSNDSQRTILRPGAELLSADFCEAHLADLRRARESMSVRGHFAEFLMRPNKAARPDMMALYGVQFRDPTADRRLMETLLTFPVCAFQAGGRPRGLARELAKEMLPEHVRLRMTRGEQSPDEFAWFAAYSARYRAAFDRVRSSRLAAEVLDFSRVGASLDRLVAGMGDRILPSSVHRALDVAQFALTFESSPAFVDG